MSEIVDMMDEDLKKIYNQVKEVLINNNQQLKNIDALDTLSEDNIEFLLNKFSLTPTKEFKAEMTNLFSISKFILLLDQQNEAIEKIEKDLNNTFNISKVSWTIYKNFKNEICFTKNKEINSDEKPQVLLIKYRIDSTTDEIIYSIAGSYWGYDITKEQLKALLEGNIPTINTYTPTDFSFNVNKDNLFVNVNGIQISIKKQ